MMEGGQKLSTDTQEKKIKLAVAVFFIFDCISSQYSTLGLNTGKTNTTDAFRSGETRPIMGILGQISLFV